MRKIPKSLAILGLLTPLVAPVNAGALGIGDIRLRSNLNQPLNAEIPLVTSGSDSLAEIKISLAPPEAFARAGIERQYFLSKLKFQATQKADGSYIIQVTSQEPITEPFLNFLLEVNWPQGHLLREFTALIDPPATYEGRTVVATEAPERAAPAPRAVAEAPKPSPPRRAAAPSSSSEGALPAAGSYGPVKKDETLWGIARLLARDAGVAPDRMMQALFQANPQAFFRNDINALKAGATLAIPSKDSIVQGRPIKPLETPPEPSIATSQKPKVKPPAPPTTPETAPRGELKLFTPAETKPEPETATTAPATTGTAQGGVPEKPAETGAIDPRISELQQQLNALQSQLSVKDEEIATLQAQQQAKQAQPEPPPPVQPPPTAETTVVPPAPPAPAPTPAPQAPVTQAPPPPVTPVARPPEHPVAPPPARPQPPAQTPAPEQNWFNWLPEAYYLQVAGAGTLLVGALIWVAVRRRAAMLDDFESMFPRDAQESAFSEIYAQKPVDSKMPAQDSTSSFKSSFLVEFSASDFDALDTESDELDPISEADVYLAYGRYKQAEELIRNAIVQFPERDECKLKLLEIHYATENREAFESYAKELYGQKKDSDPEFWGKVTEMGRELCPDSALFYSSDASILQLAGNDLFNRPPQDAESTEFVPLGSPKSDLDEDADINVRTPVGPKAEVPPPKKPGTEYDALDFGDSSDEQDDFILDFEAPTVQVKTAPQPAAQTSENSTASKEKDPMALDFDLEFLSPQDDAESALETAPMLDFGDQSFDDLTDMNELETKLDLAKAFVDMDDVSSAREILEEIAQAGNDAQKQEARSLLAKIE